MLGRNDKYEYCMYNTFNVTSKTIFGRDDLKGGLNEPTVETFTVQNDCVHNALSLKVAKRHLAERNK